MKKAWHGKDEQLVKALGTYFAISELMKYSARRFQERTVVLDFCGQPLMVLLDESVPSDMIFFFSGEDLARILNIKI